MSKVSASSNRSANPNGDSTPPSYRCATEISAAPSLPSGSQASGTSMGPPASTQPGSAQIPVRTRPTVSLNSQGHRFWLNVRKDWDNELQSTQSGLSSLYSTGWIFPTTGNALRPAQKAAQLLRHPNNTLHGLPLRATMSWLLSPRIRLQPNPALAGFEQDLYAREAQADATFTGGTTPAAPKDEETELMEEIREVEAYEKGAGESAHVEGNDNRYPEPDNGYCMSWAALDSDARAASGENVLHNG
nr:hypothetical protein L204_06190 [Cryptococcus depauperatus CBS 7855]